MEILKAKELGTCFGVDRALEITEKTIGESKTVYCLGELIHNTDVVEYFKEKGLIIIENISEIDNGKIILRSHGEGRHVYDYCNAHDVEIIDATCPKVKIIHDIVHKAYLKGDRIIIFGNSAHPEVKGINGWCCDKGLIFKDLEEFLEKYDIGDTSDCCVVFQTTYNIEKYKKIIDYLYNFDNLSINETVCNATENRQIACRELAKECDSMIIIGGKQSSNTRKLYEISSLYCDNSQWIENCNDIDFDKIKKSKKTGITAGASTPEWIIEEVINNVRRKSNA